MESMKDLLKESKKLTGTLQKKHPEFMKGFSAAAEEALKDGALPAKTKEIIAVAVSLTSACHWCVAIHVRNALQAGATPDEIREACLVCIVLGGGPAMMHTALVEQALEEFAEND